MTNESIQPEDHAALLVQYQQWLADRDLTIALLSHRLTAAREQANMVEAISQERDSLRAEVQVLRDAAGIVVSSDDPAPAQ